MITKKEVNKMKEKRIWVLVALFAAVLVLTPACSEGVSHQENNTWVEEPDADEDLSDVEERDDVICGESEDRIRLSSDIEALAGCDIYRGTIDFAYFRSAGEEFSFSEILPPLRGIEGTLNIFHVFYLQTLKGLESLEYVGELNIRSQVDLRDISALANLEEVGEWLHISGNPALLSLHGLENVHTVGRLSITHNDSLQSLDGLAGLERVYGDLTIRSNSGLSSAEIEAFVDRLDVDGAIQIE